MIACQLVVHCRLQADMGILQKSEFEAIVQKKAMQLPFLPGPGSGAVLLKTGYEAHKARQRPPAQAMPAEVPKSWAWAEKCRVEEASLLLLEEVAQQGIQSCSAGEVALCSCQTRLSLYEMDTCTVTCCGRRILKLG